VRVLTYRGTADGLLARAQTLAQDDAVATARGKRWGKVAIISGLTLVIFPLWIWIPIVFGPRGWWPVLAGMALFVVSLVTWAWNHLSDLDDHKVATLVRLATFLRADIPSAEPVELRLDFRAAHRRGRVRSRSSFWKAFWGGPRTIRYEHPWMRMSTRLADGSRLDLAIVDDMKRRTLKKRKYTRVVEKVAAVVTVDLRLASRYGAAEPVAATLASRNAPGGTARAQAIGRGRALRAVVRGYPRRRVTGRAGTVDGGRLQSTADAVLGTLIWCFEAIALPRPA
jgi:hypothetical protein